MQVLQPRVLELNTIVAEMGKMLPRLIGEHIEYSFLPDPNLAPVKADPGQIEQVILNLAVNARDAMPNGGSLVIRTQNIAVNEPEAAKRPPMLPGAYVLLSVADTGQGMDDATKVHLFEPFFTTKEVGKGTGLGLATVYGVVKQSGGFISVYSEPGHGSSFKIYLPRIATPAEPPAGAPKAGPAPGSETVLVVKDEPAVLTLSRRALESQGYVVLAASDADAALRVVERHGGMI